MCHIKCDTFVFWLFFVDYIQSVNYDGLHRNVIMQSTMEHIKGLTYFNGGQKSWNVQLVCSENVLTSDFFEGSLFGTDFHGRSVIEVDAWSPEHNVSRILDQIKHPRSIKVVHSVFENEGNL